MFGVGNSPTTTEKGKEKQKQDVTSSSSDDDDEAVKMLSLEGINEVEAGSILGPTISRTQSDARYVTMKPVAYDEEDNLRVYSDGKTAGAMDPGASRALRDAVAAHELRNHESSPKQASSSKKPSFLSFTLPLFQLPQLPNLPTPRLLATPAFLTPEGRSSLRRRSRTFLTTSTRPGIPSTWRTSQIPPERSVAPLSPVNNIATVLPELRRSCSTPSLLSYTSSLGNDNHFASVQSMTNSRLKAIKDSLLDGLPDLSQFTIGNAANVLSSYANTTLNSALNNGSAVDQNRGINASPFSFGMPLSNYHPLDTVEGDIVVLGGYRGSTLRDKATNKQLWIPLKVGFNLRKVNLEIGLNPEDELNMGERVVADGMLTNIGPVDIGRRLLRRLRAGEAERSANGSYLGRKVYEYGYDWRLSPALLSKQLVEYLEGLPSNKGYAPNDKSPRRGRGALVIAHSLGGLIVRHAMNQRPELFSGVIFVGTPQHCVNILGPLRNGDTVLFSSKVLTAQVNFTLRSSYALLPEDGHCFVDRVTGKEITMNFFDVKDWIEYGLSPSVVSKVQKPLYYQPGLSGPLSSSPPRTPSWPSQAQKVDNSLASADVGNGNGFSGKDATNSAVASTTKDRSLAPKMDSTSASILPSAPSLSHSSSDPPTANPTTLPLSATIPYLARTLHETLLFKSQLRHKPDITYPPLTVLYSKSTPTVKGARVDGPAGIKSANAYEDLIFGAGDGVCLAKAAMLPDGYKLARKVCVERGHVGLLGDLEGVGKCVGAVMEGRGW